MTDFNVAPDTFSKRDFDGIICPFIIAVAGIGARLAKEPAEHGWDQSNCFDFEPCEHLLDAAITNLKAHASSNQLFYNSKKLEDATTLAFVEAFGDGFISGAAGN